MLEGLELIKRLWTEDNVTFEGKFFQVHDATCTIRPVQKPYLPIWVAANADPRCCARRGWDCRGSSARTLPYRRSNGNGSGSSRRWLRRTSQCRRRGRSRSNCRSRRPVRKRSRPQNRSLRASTTPMPNGARTRCCRDRKASALASTIWRAIGSSYGTPDEVIEQLEARGAAAGNELLHLPRRLAGHRSLEGVARRRDDGSARAPLFPQEIRKGLKNIRISNNLF